MPDGDRGAHDAFGKLATGIAIIILGGAFAFSATDIASFYRQRQAIQQVPGCDASKPDDCTTKGAQAAMRSAVSNEAYVDIAVWQLGLGAVGLTGVAFTVFYARLAWREAQRSADAAAAALGKSDALLTHAREAASKELRAYISIVPGEFKGKASPYHCLAMPKIVNFGKTPARNLKYRIALKTLKKIVTPLTEKIEIPNDDLPSIGTLDLGPGEDTIPIVVMQQKIQTQNLYPNAGNDQIFIYLVGEVTYKDVFGEDRYVRFCSWINWLPGEQPLWNNAPGHNEGN
jgi:hypothetical protein